MKCEGQLSFLATVEHTLIRADGTRLRWPADTRVIVRPKRHLRTMWENLRRTVPFFFGMSFATFMGYAMYQPQIGANLFQMYRHIAPIVGPFGIVTSAGINYLATTFTNNTNPLINFNFHSYGTGDVHGATSSPTNATAATPIVVTQAGHPFFTNDIIKLTGITGITGINGIWQILVINSSSYSLYGSVGGGSSFGGGTNAAQLLNGQADTALTTEVASLTRVGGTQSNPAANQYRSDAIVTFTGTTPPLTVIEWCLFSALTTGTAWDRRWMNTVNAPSTTGSAALVAAPITVTQTTDKIETVYTLTCTAGGS